MHIKFLRNTVAFNKPCYEGEVFDTEKEEISKYELNRLISHGKAIEVDEPKTKKVDSKK